MKKRRVAIASAFAIIAACPVQSADFGSSGPATRPLPPPPSFISEIRIGGFAHDPWSPEKGSLDIHGEILFAKPFTPADLFLKYFVPRPHVGFSVNTSGASSFIFAGFTWTFDIAPRVFVEASFGGAVHNGEAGSLVPVGRNALGCSLLFRESASIGYRITQNLSLMATVEHLSNGGFCSDNRGLTNVGARLGYTF